MSETKNYYLLGMAADKLKEQGMEVPATTLRGWFNELHRLKVHTLPRNERRERVLSDIELKIAEYIFEAKKNFGNQVTIKTIAEQMAERFDMRYVAEDNESFHLEVLDDERIRNLIQTMVGMELAKAKEQLYEETAALLGEKAKALLPNPEEERESRLLMIRTEQLNMWSSEKKVRQQLRNEALEEWKKNPKKTGFFVKKEDVNERNIFIEEYIEKNLTEERMKQLYENN
jgi:hypothetical protein